MLKRLLLAASLSAFSFVASGADAPKPPAGPKHIPPPGVTVPPAEKAELEKSVAELGAAIEQLKVSLKDKPKLLELLPDVQIYHKAVSYALTYNEFLKDTEIASGKNQVKQGLERAVQLARGEAPWTTATGVVMRGYISKIDGSAQPYTLLVPAEYKVGDAPRRLDFWFHGRAENLTDLAFLNSKGTGEFKPAGAFVLALYGRFCNANHFAGEVDLFEALEKVKSQYPIDTNKLVVRGFSMGGAACWHFATHHAGLWAAANPGAGFAETAEFSHLDPATIPWYEKSLWHMYDATDYAVNMFNCPIVAYSGEIDKQRQAAEIMAKKMLEEGLTLQQVIGAKMGHQYNPEGRAEVSKIVDDSVKDGRVVTPKKIRFTTFTLKYNQMKWITVDGLAQHWERARIDAETKDDTVSLTTQNVTALTLNFAVGQAPFASGAKPKIAIDGQSVEGSAVGADKAWKVQLVKNGKNWELGTLKDGLQKTHDLQGLIDDAYTESFIMVKPTGKALNAKSAAWIDEEFKRSTEHWRRIFRGDARVMNDTEITDKEINSSNLVLWGDPSSNAVYGKIAAKLPISWDEKGVHARGKDYAADSSVLALIYPNPLNPKRYVVLNSGFTWMINSSASNARHISMLPDWVVKNTTQPDGSNVQDADFFGEQWELKPVSEHK